MARKLSVAASELRFGSPVTHVYNPLSYAWQAHAQYLERYGGGRVGRVVLLGMNPGPWGMAQTGVPFGEVKAVQDWLRIRCRIGKPFEEHPKRPVQGFDCARSEVSGRRLWGWARDCFGAPERFFACFFVANYCPLMFLEASGRNRTPDRLAVAERASLVSICDRALRETVQSMRPHYVVGIGRFAEMRARRALQGLAVPIGRILHPSPASPAANRDWQGQVMHQLTSLGIAV